MLGASSPPKPEKATTKTKLPIKCLFLCGWPMFILLTRGLIGGAIGGAACGVNIKIYNSDLSLKAKIALNIATGGAAILIFLVVVRVLAPFLSTL